MGRRKRGRAPFERGRFVRLPQSRLTWPAEMVSLPERPSRCKHLGSLLHQISVPTTMTCHAKSFFYASLEGLVGPIYCVGKSCLLVSRLTPREVFVGRVNMPKNGEKSCLVYAIRQRLNLIFYEIE